MASAFSGQWWIPWEVKPVFPAIPKGQVFWIQREKMIINTVTSDAFFMTLIIAEEV
jgi:hypothetical protein